MTSNKQFEELMESVNNGIIVVQDEKIVYANTYIAKRFGAPKSKLIGRHILDFVHPDKQKETKAHFKSILYSENPILGFETEIINAKGETRVVEINSAPTHFDTTKARIFSIKDITENKEIRKLLEEKNRQIQSMYDDPDTFMGILDLDGTIISINKSALDFIGKKIDELQGKKFWLTPWWTHSNELQNKLRNSIDAVKKGRLISFKADHIGVDGSVRWVNFSLRPVRNSKGEIYQFLAEGLNITDTVLAENQLREYKKNFQDLIENQLDGVAIIDDEGKHIFVNKQFCNITGYSEKELSNLTGWDLTRPQDRPVLEKRMKDRIAGKAVPKRYERIIVKKDGTEATVEMSTTMTMWDGKNHPMAVIQDITERALIQKQLSKSEKRYRALTENAPVGVWHADLKGNITYINPKLTEISGLSLDDAIGGKWGIKVHPDDRIRVLKEWDEYIANDKPYTSTYRFVHNDGKISWILENATTIYDESNKKIAHIGTITDITDRILSEQQLKESEERYQQLSDATFEAIFISEKGICTGQNKTAERMFGYTLDEAVGKLGTEWIAPEFRDDVMNKMVTGYEKPYEAIAQKKDGSTFPCEIQARMMEKNGKQIRMTALRDISERKNTQQRLELTMESAGLGSWDQNYKTGVVLRNDRWYEMLGYNKDEINETKLAWIELIHPDDIPVVKKASQDQDKGKSDYLNVEHRLKTKSGKWKWILNWGKIIERDKNGNPLRAVGTHLDIDARKKIELSLKDSENKFRSILVNVQLLAVMLDDKANITFANRFLLKKTGWKKKEVIGNNYFDLFVSKDARTSHKNRFNEIIKSRALFSNRVNEVITKDGKQLTVDWNVTTQYDEEGNLIVATSIGNDITEKLQIEADLRFQSELIKQSYESMITTDLDFKITWTNAAFTKLFGYTREDVLGKTPDLLNAEPMSKEIQQGIYESMQAGKLLRTTLLNKKKDGSTFVCQLATHPVMDKNGKVIAYSGHQHDVTEMVTAQKELEESESKYHDLFEHQLEAYAYHEIILNKKGEAVDYKFLDVNDQFLKELNLKKKSDVIGKTLMELDPRIDKKWIKVYGEVALTGRPKRFEDKFAQNGKWYKIYAYSPRHGHFATSFIDITDEKKAEEEIKQSEERFRSTFESVGEGIILIGKDGKVSYVNESLTRMTGIDYKDIVGIHALKLAKKTVSAKQLPIVTKNIINAFEFKKLKPFDVNYNQKTFNVSVAFNKLNKNIIGILHDVTDKKKADLELQEHRNHLEELVEKRTIDLKKKNEELDNALKVFVGRELTIKNLRNEISKLEKELKLLKN